MKTPPPYRLAVYALYLELFDNNYGMVYVDDLLVWKVIKVDLASRLKWYTTSLAWSVRAGHVSIQDVPEVLRQLFKQFVCFWHVISQVISYILFLRI